MRSFEFARKMVDGEAVREPDERNVIGEVKAFSDAQLPEYQTSHSAGADFFCAEEVEIPSIWELHRRGIDIKPTLVHTGVKASMEDDEVLELYNRSSNPKKLGLILANGVGVVDSDYYNNPDNDGEIMFAFYNIKHCSVTLKVGDRIGQGVFKKFLRPESGLRVKDSSRSGGFGSTGSSVN